MRLLGDTMSKQWKLGNRISHGYATDFTITYLGGDSSSGIRVYYGFCSDNTAWQVVFELIDHARPHRRTYENRIVRRNYRYKHGILSDERLYPILKACNANNLLWPALMLALRNDFSARKVLLRFD